MIGVTMKLGLLKLALILVVSMSFTKRAHAEWSDDVTTLQSSPESEEISPPISSIDSVNANNDDDDESSSDSNNF